MDLNLGLGAFPTSDQLGGGGSDGLEWAGKDSPDQSRAAELQSCRAAMLRGVEELPTGRPEDKSSRTEQLSALRREEIAVERPRC